MPSDVNRKESPDHYADMPIGLILRHAGADILVLIYIIILGSHSSTALVKTCIY